eukprot:CAMPEP_0113945494 /NCGR_PEP_ID=MMETSP1339-20121228/46712_1 /TAXON_ID=94617 /ORGANISM="Fibrocapsa japonica" /LENGTH=122 /DNA_ID=CAMNT_0000951107 /DNA_START=105 /DNA_END=470 /DNA_ORIENTATION=- /assembly_acc=CAM_ASM_000762
MKKNALANKYTCFALMLLISEFRFGAMNTAIIPDQSEERSSDPAGRFGVQEEAPKMPPYHVFQPCSCDINKLLRYGWSNPSWWGRPEWGENGGHERRQRLQVQEGPWLENIDHEYGQYFQEP